MEIRFHQLEHESKMRLLKTHTPLNGDVTKPTGKAKKNGKERRPSRKGQANRQ